MKYFIIIATALCISGCSDFNNQNIANIADKMVAVSEQLTETIVPLVKDLNEQGIVSDVDTANVVKISDEIEKVNSQVAEISQVIAETNGVIETLQAVNEVTAPYNPWSMYISIGLGIVSTVLGLFAKKKTDEANLSSKALAQTVVGVQKIKQKVTDLEVGKLIKTELSSAQDQDTKDVIALIKNKAY